MAKNEAKESEKKEVEAKEVETKEVKAEEVKPAIVDKTIVKVRGTAVGGVKSMTLDEHKKYCADTAKAAKKA